MCQLIIRGCVGSRVSETIRRLLRAARFDAPVVPGHEVRNLARRRVLDPGCSRCNGSVVPRSKGRLARRYYPFFHFFMLLALLLLIHPVIDDSFVLISVRLHNWLVAHQIDQLFFAA